MALSPVAGSRNTAGGNALTVISPISGSGALTVFENILKTYGADSTAGRVASVIMGSTETTFYAVTVYFGSLTLKKRA
jgi:spore maturation protein B